MGEQTYITLDEARSLINDEINAFFERKFFPDVKIFVLPGGRLPERKSPGANGFDFFLRAVVSPFDMDPEHPYLRKTLFNFEDVPKDNPEIERHLIVAPTDNGNELVYRLEPMESALVGIGVIVEMDFPMFHWVGPRSGLASKWGISVTNAPGTVDSDFRGEAGVVVQNWNRERPFLLKKDMRIAQAIFNMAVIPNLVQVQSYDELSPTVRGAGGFGSTGIR